MTRHPRRRAAASIGFGVAVMVAPFVASPAGAQDELVSYLALTDSDGITQTGGEPTSQGYPQVQSKTAHTASSMDTGENGLALASTQWPGELAGNLGSLVQVFGAPEEAGALNYPVRAEASTVGPAESSQEPGMYARVEGPLAEAIASSEDFDGDGSSLITFGNVETESRSELVSGEIVSTATAVVSDIDIGGVITIDSVQTMATARTNGVEGVNEGSATVSGLEIAGRPARVDDDGVQVGDGSNDNPADAITQVVIDEVLSNFADAFVVDMYLSDPATRDEETIQEHRSGSLVITIEVGDPEAGQGGIGVFAIGGSNAYAQAAVGTPLSTPTTIPTTVAAPIPPTAPSPSVPAPTTAEIPPSPAPTTSAEPPTTQLAAPPVLDTEPISRFQGLGFAMPILALLGAFIAGRGLHQFHLAVARPRAGEGCVIDTESS